jgi:hypothetical protein
VASSNSAVSGAYFAPAPAPASYAFAAPAGSFAPSAPPLPPAYSIDSLDPAYTSNAQIGQEYALQPPQPSYLWFEDLFSSRFIFVWTHFAFISPFFPFPSPSQAWWLLPPSLLTWFCELIYCRVNIFLTLVLSWKQFFLYKFQYLTFENTGPSKYNANLNMQAKQICISVGWFSRKLLLAVISSAVISNIRDAAIGNPWPRIAANRTITDDPIGFDRQNSRNETGQTDASQKPRPRSRREQPRCPNETRPASDGALRRRATYLTMKRAMQVSRSEMEMAMSMPMHRW